MPQTLDAALLRRWAEAAVDALDERRAEIDRINVFPVADRDTGTNLLLTMRAAAEAAARQDGAPAAEPRHASEVAAALAAGALRGARGSSGVILAQVLRGLADAVAGVPASSDAGGAMLSSALTRAAELARAAVAQPRDGTVLSVLTAAASAAAETAGTTAAGTTAAEASAAGTTAAEASAAGTAAAGTGARSDGVGTERPRSDGGRSDGPRSDGVRSDGERSDGVGGGVPELGAVARAAAAAGAIALGETPGLLPELARAGVVDAGGLGLVVVLDALLAAITGEPQRRRVRAGRPVRDRDALIGEREVGSGNYDYEVMFLLDGSTADRVATLRAELGQIGDAVAVVGDGAGLWNVHVHCTDVGAAIEAGIVAGRPHRITVVRFADRLAAPTAADRAAGGRFNRARAVLAVVTGEPVAVLARGEGVAVLRATPPGRADEVELAAALAGTRAAHVVLLPNDPDLTPAAERAAARARSTGQDVVVVPTSSVVQGLAALAVHDPQRRAEDDVVAMAEAAGATRTGGVLVADSEALTWAGRCRPGDILGLADGEVVLIERECTAAARSLLDRMLGAGGELVTVLLGEGAGDDLAESLAAHLAATHPEVEVAIYRGGQPDYLVLLGVE